MDVPIFLLVNAKAAFPDNGVRGGGFFVVTEESNMEEIKGSQKNLRMLFQNMKYSIPYYQREYRWERKHIEEMIEDLTSEFLNHYHSGDSREQVKKYGAYFMGSIVIDSGENAIVDGQQRFSSLSLLLIYLNNRLHTIKQSYNLIEGMIFSESFGNKSFNINVEDRAACMKAMFNDEPFDASNSSESVKTLYERFSNIKEIFPDEINDDMLFHFCDWLSEKVFFMEIEAKQERDAQKIFVSINDRGLKLSSAEMLKGYLLSEIKDDQKREELNELWKETVFSLTKDENNGEENFIKSWFKAQYAKTIRGKKAGDEPQDYELIGGAFHEWVRNNKKEIKLNTSDEFESFIRRFSKFAEYYRVIREAEKKFSKEETEYIYYNAQIEFTMQTQLLLAPICDEDDLTAVKNVPIPENRTGLN